MPHPIFEDFRAGVGTSCAQSGVPATDARESILLGLRIYGSPFDEEVRAARSQRMR